MLSQNVVQGCVKMWSKYAAQHNWTTFWLKKWCFLFLCFLLVFLKNLILPAERIRFLKNKKKRENLDHILTQKKANLGPHFDSTAYLYIYIYCEVIIWAKFGHFRCYLGQVGVIIWAKLFIAYKNSGFKRFLALPVIILCFFCAQLSGNFLKIAFFKKRVQKLGFSIFCV